MSTDDISSRLAVQLRALWQLRHGETPLIENLRPLSAGASAQTFSFEVGKQRYIAQLFGGGEKDLFRDRFGGTHD